MQHSLFEVNSDGTISYSNVPEITPEVIPEDIPDVTPESIPDEMPDVTPEVMEEENEVLEDVGNDFAPDHDVGDVLETPEDVPESEVEDETQASQMAIPLTDDGSVPVVLNEEVTAAILNAMTPASGSIGSSTLEYFDRVVSGLSKDYKYIAYRVDGNDSYDAVLYYGRDYDVTENSIQFHDDAVELRVDRNNSAGNNQTYYYTADASHSTINFSQGSSLLYYTNAKDGYPVLGGYKATELTYSPFIVSALITAAATVILSKLLLKR